MQRLEFNLRKILEKATKFTSLYANPDFQDWKKDVVDKRLDGYLSNILSANLDREDGREFALKNLTRYQELKFVTDDVFRIWQRTEDETRKKLES